MSFILLQKVTEEYKRACCTGVAETNGSHEITYSTGHVCSIHHIFHANPGKGKGILNICMRQTNGGDTGMRATDPFQRAGVRGWFGG
jgi:hypothetical protein